MPVAQDRRGYRPRVLFFDVFETMLSTDKVTKSVSAALGDRPDLARLWFATMLQYSLVSTLGDRYRDFADIGIASLEMVACSNGISLGRDDARHAVSGMRSLEPHPDVASALLRLQQAGFRLVTLTNSSAKTVEAQLAHAGLTSLFEASLAANEVGYFKPHLHVYRWAARRVGVAPAECMLVAAHGWDIAGALWAGCRAAFVERTGQQLYPLADAPELVVKDFGALAKALIALPSIDSYTE